MVYQRKQHVIPVYTDGYQFEQLHNTHSFDEFNCPLKDLNSGFCRWVEFEICKSGLKKKGGECFSFFYGFVRS